MARRIGGLEGFQQENGQLVEPIGRVHLDAFTAHKPSVELVPGKDVDAYFADQFLRVLAEALESPVTDVIAVVGQYGSGGILDQVVAEFNQGLCVIAHATSGGNGGAVVARQASKTFVPLQPFINKTKELFAAYMRRAEFEFGDRERRFPERAARNRAKQARAWADSAIQQTIFRMR